MLRGFNSISRDLSDIDSKIAGANQAAEDAKDGTETLEDELEEAKSDIEQLDIEIDSLKDKIERLESDVSDIILVNGEG